MNTRSLFGRAGMEEGLAPFADDPKDVFPQGSHFSFSLSSLSFLSFSLFSSRVTMTRLPVLVAWPRSCFQEEVAQLSAVRRYMG